MKRNGWMQMEAKPILESLEPRLLLDGVNSDAGYSFLDEQVQQYQQAIVYSDADAGGNLFAPSGFLNAVPPQLTTDPAWPNDVHEGTTCMKIDWLGGVPWSALAFECPPGATNGQTGPGWNLASATKLTFWARAETAGTVIEFGIGDDTLDGFQIRKSEELTTNWTPYEISVSDDGLSDLNLGFLVAFGGSAATVYVDDVRFDCACPESLQLMQSYRPLPDIGLAGDSTYYRNTAFTYDNMVAVLAYMARGGREDMSKASRIMETFHWALQHESFAHDPRMEQYLGADQAFVRSAYCSGPIHNPGEEWPRLGYWNDSTGWHTAGREVSVGVNAWLILALLDYADRTGQARFLNDALMVANWIHENFHDSINGGYTLGLRDLNGELVEWEGLPKSTEHNIDCYAAFSRLADALSKAHNGKAANTWRKRAKDAGDFVMRMFDPAEGRFYAGTSSDGVTPDATAGALDAQSWAVLAMSSASRYKRKIDWARPLRWAENHLAATSQVIPGQAVEGFDFGIRDSEEEPDGVWVEGTAQMAAAYGRIGEADNAQKYLDYLGTVQGLHPNGDGKGLAAAVADGLQTVYGEAVYDARLHVGATAWALLAAQGNSPFSPTHAVELTRIPAYGSTGRLRGRVVGYSPQGNYLAVYVFAGGGWYTKPTYAKPYTRIGNSGNWSCKIVTGGVDHLASQIAAFLVPVGSIAPLLTGEAQLPSGLYEMSRGWIVRERVPDLVSAVGEARLSSPVISGDKGRISVQLSNLGFAMTDRQAMLAVYASEDDTLDPLYDVLLGTKVITISLPSRRTCDRWVKITLPASLSPQAYRVLVAIDVFNSVAESDEENNVGASDWSLVVT